MNRIVIPAPDYNVEKDASGYPDGRPYVPPPDYDQPRMRKVEVTDYARNQRPLAGQSRYDGELPFPTFPKKPKHRNEDKLYGDYDDAYRTLDARRPSQATSSLGRRYHSQNHRRHPSLPPTRERNSEYRRYNGNVYDDDDLETIRSRNNENIYGSVMSRASRWCEDCPYCQKMERLEAERLRRARIESTSQWSSQDREFPESFREESVIFQEPNYGVINKTRPLTNLGNSSSARASKVWKANKIDQLNVKQGELLQVLKKKPGWWKCRNVFGEKGWVPSQNLFIVPSEQ